MNKVFSVFEIADLNKSSISRRDSFDFINYLDTSNLTKNKIGNIQYLEGNFPSRAKRKVKNKTILYSTVRPNQEHFGIIQNNSIRNLIVSTGFTTIDVFSKEIDERYLYYKLTQPFITEYLHNIAENSVSSYPSIKPEEIGKLKFKFPDLPTQQKIASVLSALDDKVELNNQINAELEQMAKMLYDYWFVQFDFLNEEGKPYKSSGGKMVYNKVLKREIPEGWKTGCLGDLADFNPTLTLKKNSLSPYIGMASIPTNGYMTNEPDLKEFTGGIKFQNGDVVVARITPCLENGKTALISLLEKDSIGFGSTEFINIRGKKGSYTSYLAILSRSDSFRNYAISKMIGTSGRKRVDANELSKFLLTIPPDHILKDYGRLVDAYFHKMTINAKQNQQLSSLRDWLLPMLMNGQVKVGEAAEDLSMAAEPEVNYGGQVP